MVTNCLPGIYNLFSRKASNNKLVFKANYAGIQIRELALVMHQNQVLDPGINKSLRVTAVSVIFSEINIYGHR